VPGRLKREAGGSSVGMPARSRHEQRGNTYGVPGIVGREGVTIPSAQKRTPPADYRAAAPRRGPLSLVRTENGERTLQAQQPTEIVFQRSQIVRAEFAYSTPDAMLVNCDDLLCKYN